MGAIRKSARSQEDFTFDIRSWPPALNTEASEEIRSFQTWRDAVDWTRVPSNRPSTHPYLSVEIEQCLNKIFKCVSCKKYETKDLTRYVDHLYEHYQRNSLMIPDSSQEDFTFDIRSWPPALNTEASEEIRSFQTWRDAVDWTRVPSNRPSTHPYVSVEIEQCLNKIFKCVSCKTYETKDLTRYVDHLYEHFLRNSLMIPSFEEILTELRRRETVTGSETWRREF
ncbi:uncharacterized protein LOC103512760 [Diaphorina citri]|uniref:Uncharacterized protein LOC103512760 n=1 Tax=Diaphorina citri TaxID=121845 RepID=A0A3Q0J5G5_DIACI|nr:uncharacterized protein LOC103512760 [Diaphorina citri]